MQIFAYHVTKESPIEYSLLVTVLQNIWMTEILFVWSVFMDVKLAAVLSLSVRLVLERREISTIIVFVWMDFGMIIHRKIVMNVTSRAINVSGTV
jgi:hypothetical protein